MKQKAALLLALLDAEWRTVEGLFDKLDTRPAAAAANVECRSSNDEWGRAG